MQLVNWGCFDGYTRVPFAGPREVTLISGSTGVGKSTLLDAHIVLMHDAKTALNRASNASTRRARSGETRNVVGYIRGVQDQTRDADGEHPVTLRDPANMLWSAVAETWRSTDGATLTAIAAFVSTPDDTTRPTVRRDAWTIGELDLRHLQDFVSGDYIHAPLPPKALEKRFPGLTVMKNPGRLHRALWRELGIGQAGDGVKAMALLYKVQSAEAVDSVNDLFTTFVLDRPRTYERADEAIEHFEKLRDAHDKVRTIEDQIRRLSRIPSIWQRYVTGRDDQLFFDALQPTMEPADTPFWKWRRGREFNALDVREAQLAGSVQVASRDAAEADGVARRATQEWLRIAGAVAGNESLRLLPQLDTDIAAAERDRDRIGRDRVELQAEVGEFVTLPGNRSGYDQQLAASRAALLALEGRLKGAEHARSEAGRLLFQVLDQRSTLQEQIRHFTGRTDVTDYAHDQIRRSYATLAGIDPERLPYVGELLDMVVEHEAWRMAAEKALGGLARTLLVAAEDLIGFRRVADTERTNRRIPYLTVTRTELPVQPADPATIAGRLQYRAHPYAGWLSNRVGSAAGHLCVSSADALADLPEGYVNAVTIHGQTANAEGGQVGGQIGHRRSIGFSAATVVADLERALAELDDQHRTLDEGERAARQAVAVVEAEIRAHQRMSQIAWARIDLVTAETHLRDLLKQREELAADPSAQDLMAQQSQAERVMETARDAAKDAQERLEKLTAERDAVITSKDDVWTHFAQLEHVSDPDMSRLDVMMAEFRSGPTVEGERPRSAAEPQVEDFVEPAWSRFVRDLQGQYKAAESARDDSRARLTETFEDYLAVYPNPAVHTNPDLYYPHFEAILHRHQTSGIIEAKSEFTSYATEYGGHELTALALGYQHELDVIAARLAEINAALATQPYGPRDTGRIRIEPREGNTDPRVSAFRSNLHLATAGATSVLSYEEAVAKFDTFNALIDRLRDPKQRDLLLDVRQHILLEAQHRDGDTLVAFHRNLTTKSGGETQELSMFIIAAAIRYRIGSADGTTPRFAPVFMDEGLIKADPERTQRAVDVWTHLGFQPIISTTADKHESVSHTATVLLAISKDPYGRSRIDSSTATQSPYRSL